MEPIGAEDAAFSYPLSRCLVVIWHTCCLDARVPRWEELKAWKDADQLVRAHSPRKMTTLKKFDDGETCFSRRQVMNRVAGIINLQLEACGALGMIEGL
ncbi:hypothetical protein LshimejAT787_0801250 [Lyophyllum shimeji]|uniref:Uncharacterized protein n=1 Tax=Lyophyllum shimeji TaxID=47721 RepID=A0A9P3UMB4_LYOSH|nr:hypothetical protein LshimejAT787_0801250 [Lyophyllum shimeji]